MEVIQVNYDQPDKMIMPESSNVILLFDWKSYFDPEYRQKLLLSELASRKIQIHLTCSPFEAIGAFLKSKNPDIKGDIQVIDLDGSSCHKAVIRFAGGRYALKKNSIRSDTLTPLFEHYFHRNHQQIKELDQFMEQQDHTGRNIGDSVAEAIYKQSNGDRQYNKLMEIFDHELWADIQIDHFLAFKNDIAKQLSIDLQQDHCFFGLLGSVLSGTYNPKYRTAKLQGAELLRQYGASFYAAASTTIKLKVHSYPDDIDLLIVPVGTSYEEYTRPKKIPLLYAGTVTLYDDDEPICFSCSDQELSHIDLNIHLDGNQYLWATIGEQSYLLQKNQ